MNIAIIEDRISRLDQYTDMDLKKCKSVTIITGNEFDNLISSLKNNDTTSLDQYNCLISHRSAMSNEVRDVFKKYCKKNNKPLIFFSGGITSSVLKDIDFPFLHINSKEFYSENLKIFIKNCEDNNTVNLLLLQFGNKWKLSLLLNLRNKIAVTLNKEVLKTYYPNLEFADNEMIRRIRDLQINSAILTDLINDKTRELFSNDDFKLVTNEELQTIKYVIEGKINELS
jgi:hypothetical protein